MNQEHNPSSDDPLLETCWISFSSGKREGRYLPLFLFILLVLLLLLITMVKWMLVQKEISICENLVNEPLWLVMRIHANVCVHCRGVSLLIPFGVNACIIQNQRKLNTFKQSLTTIPSLKYCFPQTLHGLRYVKHLFWTAHDPKSDRLDHEMRAPNSVKS